MRYVLLFTVLLAISGRAAAFTGNELFETLKQSPRDFALGYIEGVVDAAATPTVANQTKGSIRGWTFCIPTAVTRRQSADVVLKWLEVHPEVRHNLANGLVGGALQESFPCNR